MKETPNQITYPNENEISLTQENLDDMSIDSLCDLIIDNYLKQRSQKMKEKVCK